MTGEHSLRERLHQATHRVPGVPAHVEHPAGHQGRKAPRHTAPAERPSRGGGWNHSPDRPPRVLVAWQRRIAHFFGQGQGQG
ncbi:hypothetical protein [Streptacidiphilus sp. P02-A3a]|uniref:hypothetical protein n=1 Tax=Streptacidiphilus sp. P02-A3a TaxID=2704468 RepID=UPI0015FA501E|nr:hypothetical protein [Streptacidiphilus sp. P02-A3a]QMU71419.1 hypothetical protein GXP74_27485 [Streptacidiphilus sp. P02-A3a]